MDEVERIRIGSTVLHPTQESGRYKSAQGLQRIEQVACETTISTATNTAYPPKKQMERFKYASALDLGMGYYHISLDEESQLLCTTILP